MRKQFILAASALLISAAVTAQNAQQTQTRTQNKEKTRTEVKNQPQGPVQVQDQEQYKNKGQAVSEQRHARNAERKALRDQKKALKNKGARPAALQQKGPQQGKGAGRGK